MVVTDPISDMFASLKNGTRVGREEVVVPYSRAKEDLAKFLAREGFLSGVRKFRSQNQERFFLSLQQPKMEHLRRLSTPGARWYVPHNRLPNPDQGVIIVSTSKGLMTHREARKSKLGGELVGEVW
uniref:Small ribosomal subunit protein uS8 n=1 Tax=candidate division WWE3 bacterium TaxID=2053526 RepID=A0A832DUQ4_UNCKA